MPKLTKLHNKHRLRYKVYFPNGEVKERSRLYNTLPEAKAKESLATTLEVLTSQLIYTKKDLVRWSHAGLLSSKDSSFLGANLPGQGKTFEQALVEWETTWRCGDQESQTRFYRAQKIIEILKNKPARDITFTDGLNLINELKKQGRKVATIRKYIQDLKSAFNHQLAIRYLEYNPFSTLSAGRIPADQKIKHTILTDEQIQQVIEKAQEKDQNDQPALNGTLTLHLLFFFGTGLRRKEAQEARLEHINWEERSITLPETITKTRKERTIGLGPRLYNELLPRKGQTGYILPRFAPWSVSRAILAFNSLLCFFLLVLCLPFFLETHLNTLSHFWGPLYFMLSEEDATAFLDHIVETVRNAWRPTMRRAGVSHADCEAISTAFLYEGFFYEEAV